MNLPPATSSEPKFNGCQQPEVLSIRYNKVTIDTDILYVHPLGDMHIGSRHCDMRFIRKTLSEIPLLPNHRIILMGDLIDTAIKNAIGGSVYESISTVDEQVDEICKMFEPWKCQIDGVVNGNHEWRVFKECGIDVSKRIAETLNVPYMKHTGVITYSLKKRAYNINFFHGKVGGSIENALKAVKSMANKVFADIYLMGHCHHSAHTKRQFKTVDSRNGKIVELTQYFVLTGSSLNYDESYADQMNLEISTKGFPIIMLHGDTPEKRIDVVS